MLAGLTFRGTAIGIAAAISAPRLRSLRQESGLSTILFHRFFFGDEAKHKARERLKRQLDWLQHQYTIVDLVGATEGLRTDNLPHYPLLVTVDDAKTDLLETQDIFKSFDIPIAVFVCSGWTSLSGDRSQQTLLTRVVTGIEWYDGPDFIIPSSKRYSFPAIGRKTKAFVIDNLLKIRDDVNVLEEMERELSPKEKHYNRTCSWSELSHLRRDGVHFGCHSVSHVSLATTSSERLAFEILESKSLIETRLGPSSVFAYPYGTAGTFNAETSQQLTNAGFDYAFLTHPGLATSATRPLCLPRFALPDRQMPPFEFRARVRGGGIPLHKARTLLGAATTSVRSFQKAAY